jgi:hypothetical protein
VTERKAPNILLKCEANCWMAYHRRGRLAAEIQELFGTTGIPTAFTEQVKPETVLSEIRRLNPDAEVLLAD